jgi:CBS domain-containing protein
MHSIRDILREKGATVRSIDPNVTVFDALQQMADFGIGALLVLQNGKPVGLFSERDYARKLALRGLRSRETPVSAVMSSPVITISPDSSVQEGMQVMTERFVRHLPVVDSSGGVLGMVSIGDLVKAVIHDQQTLIEQLESYIAH